MITRVSSVIRPKGSDLIFDHPYNTDYERLMAGEDLAVRGAQIIHFGAWLAIGGYRAHKRRLPPVARDAP
jgi:hypothetical protein